jgi:hypothetical protein
MVMLLVSLELPYIYSIIANCAFGDFTSSASSRNTCFRSDKQPDDDLTLSNSRFNQLGEIGDALYRTGLAVLSATARATEHFLPSDSHLIAS